MGLGNLRTMTETEITKALELIRQAIANESSAPQLGALVNPATDDRYGLQLYRWLTLGKVKGWCRIWTNNLRPGTYIGHMDSEEEGGSAMVAQLDQVTMKGNRATEFTVTREFNQGWNEITLEFWTKYLMEGMSAFPEYKWR